MNTPASCATALPHTAGRISGETATLDASTREQGTSSAELPEGWRLEAYHIDNVIHAVHPSKYTRRFCERITR